MTQMPIQTVDVSKKIEQLQGAQQTKTGSVPGAEKPDKIGRENNLRRGRNLNFTLSEFWGEGLEKGKVEKEKRKEPEIEAGGRQYTEEGIKTSEDTNGIENVRFGDSVA